MKIEPLPTRHLTDDEWNGLPPLVPKGTDKDQVLETLVNKWCTEIPVDSPFSFVHEHIQAGGFILKDVALTDANVDPPEPINIADIVRRLKTEVEARKLSKHRRLHIVLMRCRLDSCYVSGFNFTDAPFRPTFRLHNCRFTSFANFSGTEFGADSGVTDSAFDAGASFERVKLSCRPDFSGNTFFGDVDFSQAALVVDARFDRTRFHGNARFWSTDFGREPTFDGVQLTAAADFLRVRFAPHDGFGNLTVAHQHFDRWPSKLRTLVAKTGERFGWQFVRGVGGLQILTRISYAAIVLVPIIAGLWPRNLPFVDIEAPTLPIEWPLAYFAALSVAFGHLLYETSAPDLTKRNSLEDFVGQRADTFRTASDREQPDLLQQSFAWLQTAAESLPATRHPNFVKRHGTTIWLPKNPRELLQFTDDYQKIDVDAESEKFYLDRRLPTHTPEELRLIVVDEGAKAEYLVTSRGSRFQAICSTACYLAGAYLILWLISRQASTTISAAGWRGPWLPDFWAEIGIGILLVVGVAVLLYGARKLYRMGKKPDNNRMHRSRRSGRFQMEHQTRRPGDA